MGHLFEVCKLWFWCSCPLMQMNPCPQELQEWRFHSGAQTVYIVFRSVPRVLTRFWSKHWVPLESAYGWQSMQTFALRDLPELANRRWQKPSVCCGAAAVHWSFLFNWVSFPGSAVFRVCFLDDVHFISLLYGTEASGGRWNSPSSQWTSRSAHPAIGGLFVCVFFSCRRETL